jgi:hypothetical protein
MASSRHSAIGKFTTLSTVPGSPPRTGCRLSGGVVTPVSCKQAACADPISSTRCARYLSRAAIAIISTAQARPSSSSWCRACPSGYPGLIVAGYRSPPCRPLSTEEDAADVAAINETRPDFVWVGLGMPKQEKWMAAHLGRVEATALIGVGAAFDFHAGTKPRAPRWMQHSGLEWLFRLASEPRRLAGRYLIDNTIFLTHAAQQLTGFKSYTQDW